jgi:Uma2 family endonuclease
MLPAALSWEHGLRNARIRRTEMSTTALTTFAEFERLTDCEGKRELIEGEVTVMPPPDLAHSRIARQILLLFLARLDKERVWPDHTGYRIAGGWIEPDVSLSWPDQRRDNKYFLGSPMIAVEILSPGEEIDHKLTLYFAEVALEVWVIDSRRKAITVYARQNGQVIRIVVEHEFRSDAAQSSFTLAELFD